ncbi:hypothetical protein CGRA01v4_10248 [Colletotrichum graminicola]|nr:hypothetical protein CGRA01v4_10248 [Colletotrichum graminicola]
MLMHPSLTGTCVGLESLSMIFTHFGFPQHQVPKQVHWLVLHRLRLTSPRGVFFFFFPSSSSPSLPSPLVILSFFSFVSPAL